MYAYMADLYLRDLWITEQEDRRIKNMDDMALTPDEQFAQTLWIKADYHYNY